jgi:putative pre-16S rRNA nuclease
VRVLALDFGRARTGVAVSDPSGMIARPLCVVERAGSADGLARIAALIGEHQVERVVVGLPLTLSGGRGEQARETESFVEALSASRPTSPSRRPPTRLRTRAPPHTC